MEEGLLESIAGSVIDNASEHVVSMAVIPIKQFITDKNLASEMDVKEPIQGPIGLLIKVNTRSPVGTVTALVNEAVDQLVLAKVLDSGMITQLHAAKISSFEETVEVFLFSLEDPSNGTH